MDYDDLRAKAEAALSGDDDAWLDYRLASPPQAVLALLDRVEELEATLGERDRLRRGIAALVEMLRGTEERLAANDSVSEQMVDFGVGQAQAIEAHMIVQGLIGDEGGVPSGLSRFLSGDRARSVLGEDTEARSGS